MPIIILNYIKLQWQIITNTNKHIHAKLTNRQLPSWHLDVPGDCDERTGTQTSLRAKARVPVARCPWQIAGIPMIDDGERQPPPEPKTLVVVVTTTTNATAVTTTTTQHGSRKRHLKQSMCPCQIAHGKTSVTQETSARTTVTTNTTTAPESKFLAIVATTTTISRPLLRPRPHIMAAAKGTCTFIRGTGSSNESSVSPGSSRMDLPPDQRRHESDLEQPEDCAHELERFKRLQNEHAMGVAAAAE